jgi:hypothetical protein
MIINYLYVTLNVTTVNNNNNINNNINNNTNNKIDIVLKQTKKRF